ncbi:MAG TPA: tyrosinase family protein [Acidimicrobiales bacterium]|nr:tyrosinase family protein [Acidimicrobiales bacterium]
MRVRRSLTAVQDDYAKGDKAELEALWRAWKGIKELPPDDPCSFFTIGGYHGEPFRGAGWGSSAYWGGYCNHGNVLFPTWHRAYLLRLEDALRSVPGCADVTLPFWDETSDESATSGIPWALTVENVELDGRTIPNPLRSFVFTRGIVDHLSPFPDADYSKPVGYETVRYPLSGLVGPADRGATEAHNKKFPDHDLNVKLLNLNVVSWLTAGIVVQGKFTEYNVRRQYRDCLDAPNYTAFSNTTSAAEWNDQVDAADAVVPLESPHNHVHLAVGGFEIPGQGDFSPIAGANGDMGENDTAGLDPIFFFHHCHVDRMFWLWQKRHASTGALDIIEGYPGTNSVDSQGPTPGVTPNSWLGVDSPLAPFRHPDGRPVVSADCVDIEQQLGYTYGPGSLEELAAPAALRAGPPERRGLISVRGVNRAAISGSFLISAFADVDGVRQHIGTEAILSRWHVEGCMNCQTHLEARAHFPIHEHMVAALDPDSVRIEVHTRRREDRGGPGPAAAPSPRFSVRLP